jgi:hypothetical protein
MPGGTAGWIVPLPSLIGRTALLLLLLLLLEGAFGAMNAAPTPADIEAATDMHKSASHMQSLLSMT